MTIRELRVGDREGWRELWAAYLAFYRAALDDHVTDTTFLRLCDGEQGMFGLVAVDDHGQTLGFAHSLIHPSTWTPAGYCYLEDLYVAPAARGSGVAEELIEATAAAARARGVARMYWQTQQFNGAARSLYDRAGRLTSMIVYQRDT